MMFARNSLEGINFYNQENKELSKILLSLIDEGVYEFTVPYILKISKISQFKIYNCLHELLDLKIVILGEYSICPYCYWHNNNKDIKLTRCKRCKNVYSPENIVEKFKINL